MFNVILPTLSFCPYPKVFINIFLSSMCAIAKHQTPCQKFSDDPVLLCRWLLCTGLLSLRALLSRPTIQFLHNLFFTDIMARYNNNNNNPHPLLIANNSPEVWAVSSLRTSPHPSHLTRPHSHVVRRKVIIISNCWLVPYCCELLGSQLVSNSEFGPSFCKHIG